MTHPVPGTQRSDPVDPGRSYGGTGDCDTVMSDDSL